jgi:hypothetical protein
MTTNLYLMSTFSDDQKLSLRISYDGTNWGEFVPNFREVYSDPEYALVGPVVRDPSIIYDEATESWLCVYTYTYDGSNAFGIAQSFDLISWNRIAMIDAYDTTAVTATWAPEFFVDTDGTLRVLGALATGTSGEMEIYEFNATSGTRLAWSARSLQIAKPAANVNLIDPFMMIHTNGAYWLWVNQYNTGSPYNRYYVAYTNTAGVGNTWYPHKTNTTWTVDSYEGLSIVTKPGGGYRAYLDKTPGGVGNIFTSESADLYTWTAPAAIVCASNAVHGTVVRLSDPLQRANVMANWGKSTNLVLGDLTVNGTLTYDLLTVDTAIVTNLYGKIGWITNANGEYVPTGSSNVTWSGIQTFSGNNLLSGSNVQSGTLQYSTNAALGGAVISLAEAYQYTNCLNWDAVRYTSLSGTNDAYVQSTVLFLECSTNKVIEVAIPGVRSVDGIYTNTINTTSNAVISIVRYGNTLTNMAFKVFRP